MNYDTSFYFQGAPANQTASEVAQQMAQVQLMGRQTQQVDHQLRQLAQQETDDRAVRSAFSQNLNPDGSVNRAGTLKQLATSNPMAGQKLQHQWLTEDATVLKSQREARKSELEAGIKELDAVSQLAGSATDQTSYERALAQGRAMGFKGMEQMPAAFDPGLVGQYRRFALTAKDQAEMEWKKLEAERKANEPVSSEGKLEKDIQRGAVPAEQAGAYRKKAQYIQPPQTNMIQLLGSGAMGDQVEAYKKGILAGQLPFPTGRDLQDPVRAAAYKQAVTEDPTFNANTHKQRATTFQKFTTGPEAQTLNKIGTALSHLAEYSDILEKVPDVGFGPLNEGINKFRGAAGNTDIARANTARTTLANELEGAYRAGGGTEAGIEHMRQLLDPNLPLAARRANLATVTALLQGKQKEMETQYKRGMGKFGVPLETLSPEARAAQEKVLRRGGEKPQAAPKSNTASSLW